MDNNHDLLLYGDIAFDAKPDAVPYNYRISYKVTQLCLIMNICGRGGVCSLIKLQMVSFALFSHKNIRRLIDFADGNAAAPLVRFDPVVNKALTFAMAYGFVEQQKSGNFKLTSKGVSFAEKVKLDKDLLKTEISDLGDLSKKLTEAKIKELSETWGVEYVED